MIAYRKLCAVPVLVAFIHGEFSMGCRSIRICLGTGIYGRSCVDKTLCCMAFGISSMLGFLVELSKGELEELVMEKRRFDCSPTKCYIYE